MKAVIKSLPCHCYNKNVLIITVKRKYVQHDLSWWYSKTKLFLPVWSQVHVAVLICCNDIWRPLTKVFIYWAFWDLTRASNQSRVLGSRRFRVSTLQGFTFRFPLPKVEISHASYDDCRYHKKQWQSHSKATRLGSIGIKICRIVRCVIWGHHLYVG